MEWKKVEPATWPYWMEEAERGRWLRIVFNDTVLFELRSEPTPGGGIPKSQDLTREHLTRLFKAAEIVAAPHVQVDRDKAAKEMVAKLQHRAGMGNERTVVARGYKLSVALGRLAELIAEDTGDEIRPSDYDVGYA